jgi:protein-S-isoprenylcysteine O-methyltransferase Ste14
MAERMTIWGIGPKLAVFSFAYSIIPLLLTSLAPGFFIVSFIPTHAFRVAGVILLAVGIPFWAASAIAIKRGFEAGVLCTKVVFSLVRNPLYSSIILFIVPGMLMFFRSWVLFTIPLAAYFIFSRLIRDEEEWLAKQFGPEYLEYKARVRSILPIPTLK